LRKRELDNLKAQVERILSPLPPVHVDEKLKARVALHAAQSVYREAAARGESEDVLRRLVKEIETREAKLAVAKHMPISPGLLTPGDGLTLSAIAKRAKRYEAQMRKKYGERWRIVMILGEDI
jgi:hypothetical protein